MDPKWLFIVNLVIGLCGASRKDWIPNIDYENPDNWNVKRLPCSNDRIILGSPSDTNVSVFIQSNATMKEVVLPNDGVVALGNNVVWSFSDEDEDASCEGTDVEFVRTGVKDWFDPANWEDSQGVALLETEQIPCAYDDVVFPQGSRFYVQLDTDVTVGSMQFAGQGHTTNSFTSFLESSDGEEQFTSDGVVSVAGCQDTSGCPCGNDGVVRDRICKMSCLPPLCKKALLPSGACCAKCGCTLTMQYNKDQFVLDTFKNTIKSKFQNDYTKVLTSTSKTKDDNIQFFATDDYEGKDAAAMCEALRQDILNNKATYGITNVTKLTSGEGTGKQTDSAPLETGAIAGIIVAVLVILALVMVVALILRRGWCSRRDKKLDIDMELAGAEFVNHPTDQSAVLRGFDNPMYDTPPKSYIDDTITKYNPMYSSAGVLDDDDDTMRGFSNPVDVDVETAFADSLADLDTNIKTPLDNSTA
ncbi:protein amnionless-like [Glandiceps talaboti]